MEEFEGLVEGAKVGGTFEIGEGRTILGELTISGLETSLYLHDGEFFFIDDAAAGCFRGDCLGTTAADRAYSPFEAYLLEIVDEQSGSDPDFPEDLAFGVRVLRRSSGISPSGRIEWGEELTEFDPEIARSAVRRSGLA